MPLPQSAPVTAERVLLRDRAYDKLLGVIQDGTVQPGEQLVDDQLTRWMGISRTPIREAILKLASFGLIEMASNRYTRVAIPTKDNLEESFELVVACGLIGARHVASFADATEVHDRLDAMRSTSDADSRTKIVALARVLAAVTSASGRPYLADLMGPQVERMTFNALIALDGDLWDPAREAQRLSDALMSGNAAAVADVLHALEDSLRAAIARLPEAGPVRPW